MLIHQVRGTPRYIACDYFHVIHVDTTEAATSPPVLSRGLSMLMGYRVVSGTLSRGCGNTSIERDFSFRYAACDITCHDVARFTVRSHVGSRALRARPYKTSFFCSITQKKPWTGRKVHWLTRKEIREYMRRGRIPKAADHDTSVGTPPNTSLNTSVDSRLDTPPNC